jgi:hypothetical protein
MSKSSEVQTFAVQCLNFFCILFVNSWIYIERIEMSTNNSVEVVQDTIRVTCKAKEVQASYEADVPLDISGEEIVAGLNEEEYLPALVANERWVVIHGRSGREITATLKDVGAQDGDQIILDRQTHGARG